MEDVRRRIAVMGITSSIRETSPTEYEFFHELIKRHYSYKEKWTHGSDLAIRRDVMNPQTFALDIVNSDGTIMEISWRKCVTGKSESQSDLFHAALRSSVADQIAAFREQSSHVETCGICDKRMDPHDNHVDHILHFATLVANVMALHEDITIPTEYEKEPLTYRTRFKEEDLPVAQLFSAYHREHATLRMVCSACNMKREKLSSVDT